MLRLRAPTFAPLTRTPANLLKLARPSGFEPLIHSLEGVEFACIFNGSWRNDHVTFAAWTVTSVQYDNHSGHPAPMNDDPRHEGTLTVPSAQPGYATMCRGDRVAIDSDRHLCGQPVHSGGHMPP